MGWKRLLSPWPPLLPPVPAVAAVAAPPAAAAVREYFDLLTFNKGVLSGEAGKPILPPGGLMVGYMMLMREGEGEGALEERVLDTLEEGLTSQLWSSSKSSVLEGPPSEMSAQ